MLCCAVALVLLASGLVGCRRAPKVKAKASLPAKPETIVLDYRNGWFHPASGQETIAQIASRYDRDAELVGQLNNASVGARPIRGMQLYIPPSNDKKLVHETLVRIQNRPDLVPSEPWRPDLDPVKHADPQSKKVIASKSPTSRKKRLSSKPIIEDEAQAQAEVKKTAAEAAQTAKAVDLASLASPAASDQQVASAAEEKRVAPKADATPALARHEKPAAKLKGKGKGAAESFLWPVTGKVVTKFKGGWKSACHGIEIQAEESTPVRAARSGKVLLAQKFPGYGQMVLIDHGDGYASVYAYNAQILVRPEQTVAQGEAIASVGRPSKGGRGTLFFQIRRDAQPVDPLTYLN